MKIKKFFVHLRRFYRFLAFVEEKRMECMVKSGRGLM